MGSPCKYMYLALLLLDMENIIKFTVRPYFAFGGHPQGPGGGGHMYFMNNFGSHTLINDPHQVCRNGYSPIDRGSFRPGAR